MHLTGRDLEGTACLFEGRNSRLYLLSSSEVGRPVVVKWAREDAPCGSWSEADRLANEHAVTQDLSIPGIRRSLEHIEIEGRPALVLEYIEGSSIQDVCEDVRDGRRMSLPDIVTVSISAARALGEMHRSKVVHRNICSSNVLLNRGSLTATIIDFGIAARGGSHSGHRQSLEALDGFYSFMSPEQSGRMNRPVDTRSDLYSCGVVLYQMLTGRLPFSASDPLELIHLHVAREPTPPRDVEPAVPEVLSEIVMKLMAKDPGDRYQSAHGLQRDLENCLGQLQTNGSITPFALAQEDFAEELRITGNLYGRDPELRVLSEALENACDGVGQVVLVSGAAGVGKSALVNRMELSASDRGGCFITGTGDVYRRNTPHHVLIQAFNQLIDRMLMRSSEDLARWKIEIPQTLGADAAVLLELIPRLALIIGRPSDAVAPAVVDPQGTPQASLRRAFQGWIRAVVRRGHPVVLFIDNLQWVDESSCDILQHLLSNIAGEHLLFVGAYRESEVGPSHPLSGLIDALKRRGTAVRNVQLSNLSRQALGLLVSDALGADTSSVQGLSDIIHAKTGGSPIFAVQFLQSLSESGLLAFDGSSRAWKWDSERIRAASVPDTLALLMTGEIQRLPPRAQELLARAACIGNRFDLETLSMIADQSPVDARNLIETAMESGLIVPVEEAGLPGQRHPAGRQASFEFVHVRERESARALLGRKAASMLHLAIGRLRMRGRGVDELGDRLFEVTDHFNEGFHEITEGPEKLLLVELNFACGRRAKRACAYREAIWYFSMATGMLPADRWERHRDLCEGLYLEAMETEVLCSNPDRAELLSSELLRQMGDDEGRISALRARMEAAREKGAASQKAREQEQEQERWLRVMVPRPEPPGASGFAVGPGLLDVNTVIKASQAIASEIDLDRLLIRIMGIVVQNAGAERGFLIENRNGRLFIQARCDITHVEGETPRDSTVPGAVPIPVPIEESGSVPLSVVLYVARTGTPVVLNDASRDRVYGSDAFVTASGTRSLLCAPIVYQGSLWGVLYLENNLASGVFTPERIELLRVLSSQAAISIENARLYASLEKKVQEARQAQESLKLSFERSATLLKLNQMTGASADEIMGFALEEAVRLTKSQIGYLAFLNEEETILTMQLWSHTVAPPCNADRRPTVYPLETTGLWGEAVRQRRAIITNDYEAPNPCKRGMPEGHVQLLRHMNVPVFVGERIVLVAGVGNKEDEYNETDVQQLTLLMEGMWRLIERKKSEEAILAANERFRSVLRAATAYSIIGTDPDGVIGVFNEGAELMLGYRAEEVLDCLTPEVIHDPGELAALALELGIAPGFEVLVASARNGRMETREWTYVRKGGARLTVSLTVTATRGESGALTGFTFVAQDITERKRAVEKLKESEERLRLALEATGIGIWDWDVQHDRWYASSICYTMLGHEPRISEGDGSAWMDRFHTDDRAEVAERIQAVLSRDAGEFKFRARSLHADGSYRWQQVHGSAIKRDERGDVTRILGIQMDVHDRETAAQEIRRLNEQLEERVVARTAELLAANRELETFTYSVSHDLRQPLRHIDAFLALLKRRIGGSLDEEGQRYVATISGAALRMARLIDDLLSFSRSGRFEMNKTPVDLNGLVQEVIRELAPHTGGRAVDWCTGSLPVVSGDHAMLRVVLENLISNALKFTRPRDRARIEIGCLTQDGAETVVFVRDNGVGFDMQYSEKLFGVFERLHGADEFEGTGIGLANVRRIINRHGGRTWAEGKVDGGATFYFSLPR